MTDEFYTIHDENQSEIKVKGSKFIATAAHAASPEEAEAFITRISKKYFDATHNCYAYHIGFGASPIFRYNDDGEPSGTAGKPIYQAVLSKQLTDIVIVVTRYFGGTKLGTGGLVRAYGDAALAVIAQCPIVTEIIYESLMIRFPYEETNTVMRLISSVEGKITETHYEHNTEMNVQVRTGKMDYFKSNLIDLTRGRAEIFEYQK
ncbi:YigZ family protein [bacterium]|nr:YigZ family protein [bacterium]